MTEHEQHVIEFEAEMASVRASARRRRFAAAFVVESECVCESCMASLTAESEACFVESQAIFFCSEACFEAYAWSVGWCWEQTPFE